ncbi:MAG: hypothetical protein K6C99_01635 [Lachnospiraceae bacterium]|nr:hypothetical protein [Lachnospiraceae bacterium]
MQTENEYMTIADDKSNRKKINPLLIFIPSAVLLMVAIAVVAALIFFNSPKNKVMRAFAVALGDSFPFAEYIKSINPVTSKKTSFFDDAQTIEQLKEACDNRQFYSENSFKLNSVKTNNGSTYTADLSGIKLDSALYVDKPGRRIQYRLTPGYLIIKGPQFIFTQEDNIFSFHSPSLIDTPFTIDTENFGPDYNASEFADIIGYRFPANAEDDIKFNIFDMTEAYESADGSLTDNFDKSDLKALYDAIEVKKTGNKELISSSVGQSEECSEYLVTLPEDKLGKIILPIIESYDKKNEDFIKDNHDLISALCMINGSDIDSLLSGYSNELDSFMKKADELFTEDITLTVWLNKNDELKKAECDLFTWEIAGAGESEGSYLLSFSYRDETNNDLDIIISRKNTFIKNKTKAKSNKSEYSIRIDDISEEKELINISFLSEYDCEADTMIINGSTTFEDTRLTFDGECDVTTDNKNGPMITFDFDHINFTYYENGNEIGNMDISDEFTFSGLENAVYEELPSAGTPLFKMSRNEFYSAVSDGVNNYLDNTWAFGSSGSSGGATVTPDQVEDMFSNPLLLYLLRSGL